VNQTDFGKTIGDITTRIQTDTAETGTTSYTVYMDKLKAQTQGYYNSVISFMSETVSEYNWGVYQATVASMNYNEGKMLAFNTEINSPLFGKPAQYQQNIDEVFTLFIKDIETGKLPFSGSGAATGGLTSSRDIFQKNYVTYVNELKSNFQSKLTERIQTLTSLQQDLGYLIDCSNLVASETDSYLMTTGLPKIFNLSGTTIQTGSTSALTANTYATLISDFTTIGNSNAQFITDLSGNFAKVSTTDATFFSGNSLYNVRYVAGGGFSTIDIGNEQAFNTIEKKREYFIMCQTILKNFEDFRKKVLNGIEGKDITFTNEFLNFYSGNSTSLKNTYSKEQIAANTIITDFQNKYGNKYQKFTPYPDNVKRPFIFSTLPAATQTQTTNAKNLYTTQNIDNNQKVYNLKKKFN
jgi:hypothetical protein